MEIIMGPDWVMLSVISLLGLAAVILGLMGYGPTGVPFSGNTRVTGAAGRVVGTISIALGLALIWWSGRIFGPKASDGFAHAFVRAFPLGVAVYAVARAIWLVRTGAGITPVTPTPRVTSSRSRQAKDGFVTCPQCGKRMVDTEQEECRFCGADLRDG
jgi:hypothetical protein